MPARYWFLQQPSPTRNTKSVAGLITTAPTSDVTDVIVGPPTQLPARSADGEAERRRMQSGSKSTTRAETETGSVEEHRAVSQTIHDNPNQLDPSEKRSNGVERQTSDNIVKSPPEQNAIFEYLAIGSLPENADEEWLRREFEEYGDIQSAHVATVRNSPRPESCGWIKFANAADAAKALAAKQGASIDGHELKLDVYTSERPARHWAIEATVGPKYLAISNLSGDMNDEKLQQAFEEFGKIRAVQVPLDADGRSKGYGYIEFSEVADAARAVKAVDAIKGALTDECELKVQTFTSRRSALQTARKGMANATQDKLTNAHSTRIHIIGTHELGKLAAHSLASLKGRPPITLLFHSKELMQKWRSERETIVLVKDNQVDARVGFDVEWTSTTQAQHHEAALLGTTKGETDDKPWLIKQLIVADQGYQTLPALFNLRDRLNADSTILFLQEVEGVIDEVSKMVFQNPATRPQYIRAHSSHGLINHPTRTFAVKQYEEGRVLLSHTGQLSRSELRTAHPATFDLIDAFESSTALRAVGKPMQVLLYHKLQRLAVDSVIGPLSVVFDCKILDLRFNYMVSQNMREMLSEICAVIRKMPELQSLRPNAMKRFTVDSLESAVARACDGLQQDTMHPMARAVAQGHRSDIQFRNGYFVNLGKRFGVDMPVNLAILRLVKAKQVMNQKRLMDWIPFDKKAPRK